ncbi:helix-turn-helix domain-containing protein [Flavobacteriaceae bacterium R38]|nr:helix-turn-helix domain-containing protein [Flavobacteriaceae bacterium R38]
MSVLRLKEVLKEKEVSGKTLAETVGITETSLSRIIKGDQQPRFDLLLQIAETLDVDIRDLFNPTKEDKTPKEALQEIINKLESIKDSL